MSREDKGKALQKIVIGAHQEAATYQGVIRFSSEYLSSKSEREQPFLFTEMHAYPVLKVSDNPFQNDALLDFAEKNVRITGRWNRTFFVIETIEVVEKLPKSAEAQHTDDTEPNME